MADLLDVADPPPCDFDGEVVWDDHRCRELWAAVLKAYVVDARAAAWKRHPMRVELEALEDLTGDRRMLAYLCERLGYNLEAMTEGITRLIERRGRVPMA